MSKYSDEIRKRFAEGDARRDAGLTTPPDITRYDDIQYGPDAKWQVLDLYRPTNLAGQRLPVIVSFHGGGWVYGSKEVYQFYCMNLAQRGFAVVNFTYRLAPEFQFPAPLEDANMVFEWVLKHAIQYHLNTDQIYAVGDSAGANGLGLYAAICTNPDYAAGFHFQKPVNLRLRAIALNCGMYDPIRRTQEIGNTEALMQDYLPEHGTEAELKQICVLEHITPAYPPVFVMTASGDFLKTQAPLLVHKLEEMQVKYEYQVYGDTEHKLGHVFHCDIRTDAARLCNDAECEFFRRQSHHNP